MKVRVQKYCGSFPYADPDVIDFVGNNFDSWVQDLQTNMKDQLIFDKSLSAPQKQKETWGATISIQVGGEWTELASQRVIVKPELSFEDKATNALLELHKYAVSVDKYDYGLPIDDDSLDHSTTTAMINIIKKYFLDE